jgi:soluble cytochrome b562
MIESTIEKKKNNSVAPNTDLSEYRENIRKVMFDELRNALDEEIQKAAQELMEEQKKAIRQILEEHKAAIRQVVDEEKKSIWEKAELLRQSILRFGL